MGSTPYQTRRAEAFIIPPYCQHAYTSTADFNVYHLIFRNSFFSKHLLSLQKLSGFNQLFNATTMSIRDTEIKHFFLSDVAFDSIISELDSISTVIQKDISSALVAECHALIAIAKLCEEYAISARSRLKDKKDLSFWESINYIYDKYNENISIRKLCEIAGLSRSAYTAKFEDTFEITPKQFIIRERIKTAQHLLTEGAMSISAISDCIGFYDTSHFIKTFTAIVGQTPNSYRSSFVRQEQDDIQDV